MAVASGGYRDVVGRTLDQLRIRSWFQAMVTAEDTARHKPEPDVEFCLTCELHFLFRMLLTGQGTPCQVSWGQNRNNHRTWRTVSGE